MLLLVSGGTDHAMILALECAGLARRDMAPQGIWPLPARKLIPNTML
jgi:hypothetical protein